VDSGLWFRSTHATRVKQFMNRLMHVSWKHPAKENDTNCRCFALYFLPRYSKRITGSLTLVSVDVDLGVRTFRGFYLKQEHAVTNGWLYACELTLTCVSLLLLPEKEESEGPAELYLSMINIVVFLPGPSLGLLL
jgi:hypothetical protein